MLNIPQLLATELDLKPFQVQNALELLAEGATVPFIARYRKERTGEMNEIQLRDLFDKYNYLTELEERKAVILNAIAEQGKLTDELKAKITSCLQKTELEDLYLPYRPKRRTRATIAREKGLEPLAEFIKSLNVKNGVAASLEAEAAKYISEEKGLKTPEEALKGASDILAEEVAEKSELRAYLRDFFLETGLFVSKIKDDYPEGTTKFEMYRNYQIKVKNIAPHNMLALCRGETEGILNFDITFDEDVVLGYLESQIIKTKVRAIRDFYQVMLKDAFNRLMKASLMGEVIGEKKSYADIESIKTFETNLRELLLSAPAGMKPTLAIDPGFRTGCKVAVLDETGQFLEYQAVFPHQAAEQRKKAAQTLKNLIEKYKIELIAIGNGTASRETEEFVAEVFQTLDRKPIKVVVNESGASIYSASKVAQEEFPDLDLTVRGAISIGRRLQDPLAELVKIDAKSIGVGQYQHDVDQKLLKKKLDETVESCVNYVGVDLNTASKELLTFVSGITATVANNIVTYRNQNGAFKNRRQLLKVPKLGPKAFEQAAGFLRIRGGDNPLDNTAVHPESYSVIEAIASDLNVSLNQVNQIAENLKKVNLKKYVTDTVGEPTLRDILSELEKPGRDPRAEFKYATFKEGIKEITDLKEGMELEGIISNVANFGAFVDIGVHQDGLVHISQLADRFVDDPKKVVKVGQVVKVKVLEVNEKLKRISLSMKAVKQ
ncbi:RNA-binding transcriptional accessory protein [Nostoc sp. FACHB-152]|uniref:Tex family protein n=1 Tax=unclassified Nostoc TaxID=2593658 RepID=UPI0016893846|nr:MULTISPECIES: Tex family protein [unclassified Nostoc]MBD2450834.1 RNA-binding transcriptional accessory protein [Nostoc sp. FACHB-152]MBD2471982.1 RNA-binding transcriptional accessory protein [Nostoc sp. FACHB-145]